MSRCSHKGTGNPGCPTCDPNKARVINTLRGRVATLTDALSSVEAEQRVAFDVEADLREQLAIVTEAAGDATDERDACEARAEKAEAEVERLRETLQRVEGALEVVGGFSSRFGTAKVIGLIEAGLLRAKAEEARAERAEAKVERLEATATELARIVHYADCSECRKKLRLENDCIDAHHVEAREALAAARVAFGYPGGGGE